MRDPNSTWIDPEERAYPHGGFTRRGRVRIVRNSTHPDSPDLPYGEIRAVRVSIPDTYFTIPARMRVRGKTYRGYVSLGHADHPGELVFTPYAVTES